MTDSTDKPRRSETIPVSLVVPAVPLPSKEVFTQEASLDFKRLRMQGITTLTASFSLAYRVTERLLRAVRNKIRRGDIRAVQELLYINPEFLRIPWVGKAYERLRRLQRAQRKRGRPRGIYTIDPHIVLGFVFALRASGEVKTNHHAVRLIGRMGLSYNRAWRLYRAALKDSRLLPLLLPRPEKKRVISAEESEALQKSAIMPAPGSRLAYKLENGEARLVKTIPAEK